MKKKSLLIMIAFLFLLFGNVSMRQVSAAVDFNGAEWIQMNGSGSGYVPNGGPTKTYKFTVPSSGKVSIVLNANIEDMYMDLYDENFVHVWDPFRFSWDSTAQMMHVEYNLYLTKGTYYLYLNGAGTGSGRYDLNLPYVDSRETFEETINKTDDLLMDANPINFNVNYRGQLGDIRDEQDTYKITLPSSGCIHLVGNQRAENAKLALYSSDFKEIDYSRGYDDDTSKNIHWDKSIDLTKGTYYIIWNSSYGGEYNFNVSFTSANEAFTETGKGSNENFESAEPISLNRKYKGQIAYNETADFYKFHLSSSNTVTVEVQNNADRAYFCIYKANGEQVWYDRSYNQYFKDEVELTAGDYYIAFKRDGDSYVGNYEFAVKEPHYHSYRSYIEKATPSKNGRQYEKCSCGNVRNSRTIYYPKSIRLSSSSYVYDGRTKTPRVTVKGSDGRTISPAYYSVSYSSGRKSIGRYKVTIRFGGKYYTGTASRTFTIVPKGTSISKVKAMKKGVKVYIRSQRRETSGYQLQISSGRKFKKGKTYILGNRTKTKTIKGLKSVKKYYVRVRTFRKTGGRTYVSPWSSAKYTVTKR